MTTRDVQEIEHTFITLKDGTKLAARIWVPRDADKNPVPAILEAVPYRKRNDGTGHRDALIHGYFASQGFAGVRVDLRGSGDSDGTALDEYVRQEQDDCIAVLEWLETQSWCTGHCGMIGISWGGFNSLQVAARRPRQLKAIITACSTDDRYADDIHYMGGCLLFENIAWASTMLAIMSLPPDPRIVGDRWRNMWLNRLEGEPLYIEDWLIHQRRDDFWKHGSVCENYADIECAVYAVGGWADGYSNAVPRLLAGLKCPRRGIVGPWGHRYPNVAEPGPRIDFLEDAVRWWNHWLKGHATGIMEEPQFQVWMQESVPPRQYYAHRAGRWIAEAQWPSANVHFERYALNNGHIGKKSDDALSPLSVHSPMNTGLASGHFSSNGYLPDLPGDQREDDGKSLCFDSDSLVERLEILGPPIVSLDLTSSKPNAMLCVRLNDVAPDGSSGRVTYGVLNLTHRDSHENPTPMEPGARYRVRVKLNDVAHAFKSGHKIRVAISNVYWPLCWPSPEDVTVTVYPGSSYMELPERDASVGDGISIPPKELLAEPPFKAHSFNETTSQEIVERDLKARWTTYTKRGRIEPQSQGFKIDYSREQILTIADDDPSLASVDIRYVLVVDADAAQVTTKTATKVQSTPTEFILEASLDAFEDTTEVFSRTWKKRIPRDLV